MELLQVFIWLIMALFGCVAAGIWLWCEKGLGLDICSELHGIFRVAQDDIRKEDE